MRQVHLSDWTESLRHSELAHPVPFLSATMFHSLQIQNPFPVLELRQRQMLYHETEHI